MCLAVSGRILAIRSQPPPGHDTAGTGNAVSGGAEDGLWRLAEVDFGGVRQQVSLACLPEARVGDRVLVHVGLAIARVEEDDDGLMGQF
ncbi:HypC/HybG/HupF family hydrogenase formation chaperone [Synechococcus sp. CBW1004]|jgi:hydrogenase expression/formation protein HypC|uniref:HypC/HybG/HupF family hydrogenase formation chaperone n=1 Tax=Synechococcus sp. CBW1004 TaxID=1353136 RepID=UPI0018CE86DC|nr:HypC/HybG/HupF family hydrogenase formation chaperone [Synechococcus sp. CBW1004]QPN63462.1 HypC/HybG/HupF family hydrogenase formation chaperone [Synechococcus sp. CBW1004]